MKSTLSEILGQRRTADRAGGPSFVVVLDLGGRQLAGRPLPQHVDQLPRRQHGDGREDRERHPLHQLARLLRRALRQLGHLLLHLLAGQLDFSGGVGCGLAHLISSLSSVAVACSCALARSGATLEAASRRLPTSPSTATTISSTRVTMAKPSHSGPPIATPMV